MASTVLLRAIGLNTSPNNLDLPEGSLNEAINVVIRRNNILESRRGFKLYGSALPSGTDRVKQLLAYKGRILRHYASALQFDDGEGNFTDFAQSVSEVQSGLRIKSISANNNFYFTTSEGIKKLAAKTADDIASSDITQAGGVKALDFTAKTLVELGNQTGFLPVDSGVAYRIVWGTKDVNSNLILGTPSSRFELYSYLLPIELQDFVRLLGALDDINSGGCLISDGNYVSSLKLTTSATAVQLRNNLLTLVNKLDNDILIADNVAVAPLQISTATISGTTATVNFSSGDPTQYWVAGSKIKLADFSPATGEINGPETITSLTTSSISFTTSATGPVTVGAAATIHSNEYESITQPAAPATPVTHQDLADLQTYIQNIILRLQSEPNAIIPTANLSTYIDVLDITSTVNATLDIVIPQDVTENHFFQIYRSPVVTATGGTILGTDIIPTDELQLVYEAFPTATELAAGEVIVDDVTPDSFRGANLYTNEFSGTGIISANDVPPLAKDINVFKNYTFFANTKTRHRYNSTLVGVQSMIDAYNLGNTPKVVISDGTTTNIYRFIVGDYEVTDVTCTNGASLNASGTASYWLLYSANDATAYYIWYNIGTATDPAISGKTGIEVVALAGDTSAQIAQKTLNELARINQDFDVELASSTLTITNLTEGYTTDASQGTTTFTVSVTTQGVGERLLREEFDLTTVADVAGSLAGTYFTLNTAENRIQNYVWFKVSGIGSDPLVANKIGIQVDLITNDSAATVATKIADTLNALTTQYIASANTSTVNIKSYYYGPANDATAGTSGFTVTKVNDGAIEVLLSSTTSPSQAIDQTTRSFIDVINRNEAEILYGYYLSGSGDTPGQFLLEDKGLGGNQFFILGDSTNTGQSFNPTISPTLTISSITTGSPTTMTVTTTTAHGLSNLDTIMIAGTNSTPPIDGEYPITYVSSTQFRIPVTVTGSGSTGSLIPTSFAEFSENEEKINRIYYSKVDQPESVPILNYFDVGASDKAILRIFPLRDSLFVFKEDGLYRVSGEISPFNKALFDSSYIIVSPDSVSVANNVIYGWTTQGISTVTESGATIISRAIDDQILKLASSQYTNFKTATWGTGYDSDNAYYAFTVTETSDTFATKCYRYSNLTNSWTILDLSKYCGIVNVSSDDKLYLGSTDTNYIEQERKSFSRYDFADRQYDDVIGVGSLFSGDQLRVGSIANYAVGDVITQEQTLTTFTYNALLKKLDTDPGVNDSNYYSTLQASAGNNMRSKLESLATKLDADTGVSATNFASTIATKSGSITGISVANPTVITSASHGLVDGRVITISGSNSTPSIDGTYTITYIDANTFSIPVNVTSPGTTGSFLTVNEDFDDVMACYNAMITILNTDSGVAFSNYSSITQTTIFESIITAIDSPTKTLTLNLSLDFTTGPIIVYKAIPTTFTYGPNIMGDPLGLKQVYEATMMFANKAFTSATISFSTDLLPAFQDVPFSGSGNGIFGHITDFGDNFFGGGSHSAPLRTYIPRDCQRCRYIVIKFSHSIAREIWQVYGVTVTLNQTQSTRAYR